MNNSGLAALTYVGKIQYNVSGVNSKPESKEWLIIEDQAFFVDIDDMYGLQRIS
jgi:hypothetical protein